MKRTLSNSRLLWVFASSLLFGPVVWGGEPPTQPILRVETGMHTASIGSIAVDAAERYVVTGSDDKSVRVWELATSRLVRTIRVPAGAGNEGEVYAVSISPDGSRIAAGGWTGYEWDRSASIYIFDRQSGRMVQRIAGLPQVVANIAFSPDGKWLVVSLGKGGGIRLYDGVTFTPAGEDRDYTDASVGASFSGRGHLVTSSYDGFLRLYELPKTNVPLRLVGKAKIVGGSEPHEIAFSPDGAKIAAGFLDSNRIAIVSGVDLSPIALAEPTAVRNGSLGNVAWSPDGTRLYSGGRGRFLSVCSKGGRGSCSNVDVARNTITDLAPLRSGGLVFASGEPEWTRLSASGERLLWVDPQIANYRGQQERFLVTADGFDVQFAPAGKLPSRFSVNARRLIGNPASDPALLPPRVGIAGLDLTGWLNTEEPKLNGQPLALLPLDISRSAAFSSDNSLLLGGSRALYLYDRSGAKKWIVPVLAVARAVNVSSNGRLAVAAYDDGTIRWHRMTDGQELLALFPHTDRKRWILWTPSGYYDASPGAEELIGWQVNRGKESAADFHPASQFRSTFYRPDVIAKIFSTLDEKDAIRLADQERGDAQTQTASVGQLFPPVVEILAPMEDAEVGSDSVTIRFRVRSPSGEPVTGVRALVDGRPAGPGGRGVGVIASQPSAPSSIRELTVPMPPHDVEVSIIAEDRNASSAPATVHLRWAGKQAESFVIKPKLYVLAIGVSAYANEELNLRYSAKDASDFAAILLKQKGSLYRDVVTKVLTNERATKDAILDGLDWIAKETTSKDVAALLISGHGVNDSQGQFYYLPHDADVERLKSTGLPSSEVQSTVAALAGKTLFFVDACHSGNVMGGRKGMADLNGMINELASAENGAVVFAASSGNQYSLEDPAWNNGAFTKAVVEGLSGKAAYPSGSGKISINMLDLYISERVKELTKGRQTPTTAKPLTIADFPVAVVANE